MSQTIDINDIIDANSHNSAMALTASWANTFKKYALEDYEELSDNPANSFNIFTHLTAQGAAKMMYEQEARIAETNESTAILPKSLLNKLTSNELLGIYGTPASTTIAFCIKKSEILQYSVLEDTVTGLRRLVVNKDMTITFESHPSFTLPYNVIINVKPITTSVFNSQTGESETTTDYNIYAYYDMPSAANDGMRDIFGIYSQYISSREMRFEGETYVAFFLKAFQMQRKETQFYVTDASTSDTKISFENSLIGVEVFRTKVNTHVESLMTGVTEGSSIPTNGYCYSYDYKRNKQNYNIIFSKMNDNTAITVGDTIRIVTYTTNGNEGNIEFPYMIYNVNKLSVVYNQDLSQANQNAMLSIICLAFARDQASTGGKDQLTFEEIRQKVINKKYSRSILITDNEIINKCTELGLSVEQIQHDLTSLAYRATDKITYKNMILSTGTNNFYFDISKKERLLRGYNYYLIEPTDVFAYNKSTRRFNWKPETDVDNPENNLESYLEYLDKYNSSSNVDNIKQVMFPFYLRWENTTNPKIQVYDMCVNDVNYLTFTNYNEDTALDKLDISYIRVTRNPFRGSTNGTFDKDLANTYYVTFIVYTGENTLNKMYAQAHNSDNSKNYVNATILSDYLKQYITFELSFTGVNNNYKYIVDPTRVQIINVDTMINDGYIAYQATFSTNNFITDDKQISLKGIRNSGSISSDYSVYVPVDTTVKFGITGKFYDEENNPSNESCIAYESDSIELVKYITDKFDVNFDIESVIPGYETYEENIPYRYEEIEYYKNPNYDPNITDTSDRNFYEWIIENSDNGEPIFIIQDGKSYPYYKIKHRTGDIIYNYIKVSDIDIENGPDPYKDYFVYNSETDDYDKVEDLLEFDPNTVYYTASAAIKHKKGDLKYYDKTTGELVDDVDSIARENVNNRTQALETKYIGIIKNVAWINRLYFSGEEMYETIRNFYLDMIDRLQVIQNILFDGGTIKLGLQTTSGTSKRYQAYNLNTGTTEYLDNIALRFVFRVKYNDNTSTDYKEEQIQNATIKYINELGEANLSIDKLFDAIKNEVPDIEYINIIKINDYQNGEVQTIINDNSVTSEVLTVSQKMTVADDGTITFAPDITVNVVNNDII